MSFMKHLFVFSSFLLAAALISCNSNKPSAPSGTHQLSQLESEVIGTWRWELDWTPDSIFHIVLSYDSLHDYAINVNINGNDTMEKESGVWSIASDTVAGQDTVWMNRMKCRQINLTTNTLDSINCTIPTAGIRLNIDNTGKWVIPLGSFTKYISLGIDLGGISLPDAAFVKDH
jgi:hypothetical protein